MKDIAKIILNLYNRLKKPTDLVDKYQDVFAKLSETLSDEQKTLLREFEFAEIELNAFIQLDLIEFILNILYEENYQ